MGITRGVIFYFRQQPTSGSEQHAGRPAIIVSNEKCNEYSPVVEVVYLTSREKAPLPTHVPITSTGRQSTALCEQVSSVSVERIGDYLGHVSEDELPELNKALMISLGLSGETGMIPTPGSPEEQAIMAKVALKYVERYIQRNYSSEE